ncbi:MAG: hypothetical protein IKZ09_01010 [Clostridia bacterium]|nr:hypothetical protein [Clostridia bacterium]
MTMNNNVIHLGTRREVFWDDFFVDTEKTTARHRLIPPTRDGIGFVFDHPDEEHSISYPNVVKDSDGYKLYYITFNPKIGADRRYRLHVLESLDGRSWVRPALDQFPGDDGALTNVVIDDLDDSSLGVFYDTNPACPADERYKVMTLVFLDRQKDIRSLWCYASGDGYHFKERFFVTDKGRFDSLNPVFWKDGQYYAYVRDLHWVDGDCVRDVRQLTSTDFVNWSEQVPLQYDDGFDYQMYTNNIMIDPRVPHMTIGFPTRYVERKTWTYNDEQFASRDTKLRAGGSIEARFTRATTDAMFMCSRDGVHFHRYTEAYLTPGLENEYNWIYGDCYLSYPLVDTGKHTYTLFSIEKGIDSPDPAVLRQYTIRKDGYACLEADMEERYVVTKPFVFEGSALHLNFSTSAAGYIYVDVLDENGEALSDGESFEVFGDTTDREVRFAGGKDFAAYEGKVIRLRFRMFDARLYALCFS